MNFFVVDPEWGWEIILYFFLGGIAAGSYFLAVLIEWFGGPEDEPLADIAYRIAFPLIAICGLLLIIDLGKPLRFWHMLVKSEDLSKAFAQGFPLSTAGWHTMFGVAAFKYWSPMSIGAWGVGVFGACTFASFLGALYPQGWPGRWRKWHWSRLTVQLIGCIAGFFVASYTGGLLTATNQPMWSDTVWLAPLFLASAASTSLATLSLIARHWQIGTKEGRERLEGVEPFALGLELIILGAFAASLGDNLMPVLMTVRGSLLIFGTLLLSVLVPLLLHAHIGRRLAWGIPAAAICTLIGGFVLRYGALTTPGELLARGPGVANSFAPEEHRKRGEPGADTGNHGVDEPQTKLPGLP